MCARNQGHPVHRPATFSTTHLNRLTIDLMVHRRVIASTGPAMQILPCGAWSCASETIKGMVSCEQEEQGPVRGGQPSTEATRQMCKLGIEH